MEDSVELNRLHGSIQSWALILMGSFNVAINKDTCRFAWNGYIWELKFTFVYFESIAKDVFKKLV